jgi:hypothetical protein
MRFAIPGSTVMGSVKAILLSIFFVPLIVQTLLHLFFVPAWLGRVEHLSEIKGTQHQNLEF